MNYTGQDLTTPKSDISDYIHYFLYLVVLIKIYVVISEILGNVNKDNETVQTNKKIAKSLSDIFTFAVMILLFWPLSDPFLIRGQPRIMLFLTGLIGLLTSFIALVHEI